MFVSAHTQRTGTGHTYKKDDRISYVQLNFSAAENCSDILNSVIYRTLCGAKTREEKFAFENSFYSKSFKSRQMARAWVRLLTPNLV
jgi:hypothetical protein